MKIGLALECQKGGPDEQVLRCLLAKFAPEIEVSVATLSNKISLLNGCGNAVRNLLEEGCSHVVIVWDLYPADWGDAMQQKDRTPCLKRDRERVFQALRNANVDESKVALVGIKYMLETWLLADKGAIARFLSARTGKEITKQQVGKADPARTKNPKDALSAAFGDHIQKYLDHVHAHKIAQQVESLNSLLKRPDFNRFWEKAIQGEA